MDRKYLIGKVTFTLRYSKSIHKKLQLIALDCNSTLTGLIVKAIENFIKDYENNK